MRRLGQQVAETDRQIEAINRVRSLSQAGAATNLSSIQADWVSQVGLVGPVVSPCCLVVHVQAELRPVIRHLPASAASHGVTPAIIEWK